MMMSWTVLEWWANSSLLNSLAHTKVYIWPKMEANLAKSTNGSTRKEVHKQMTIRYCSLPGLVWSLVIVSSFVSSQRGVFNVFGINGASGTPARHVSWNLLLLHKLSFFYEFIYVLRHTCISVSFSILCVDYLTFCIFLWYVGWLSWALKKVLGFFQDFFLMFQSKFFNLVFLCSSTQIHLHSYKYKQTL